MKIPRSSCQWLLLTFAVAFLSSVFAAPLHTRKLKERPFRNGEIESKALSEGFDIFHYGQTLDHFNYKPGSYRKFRQRYVVNKEYWKDADAPVLAYLGEEDSLDSSIGLLTNHAMNFEAFQVYIEYRYYGESIPFGSKQIAFRDATTLGYLNSAQALADYAEILIHIKKTYHAKKSPIIVFGASYGGMLASWFRLKYPHIALGALASSAPILYFDDITPQNAFALVVSNDFKEVSRDCYETIKQSWSKINEIAATPNGLSLLSKRFKTCRDLRHSSELKSYLSIVYTNAAKDSWPRVKMICQKIDETPTKDDILDKIYATVVAVSGEAKCYVNPPQSDSYSSKAWNWQVNQLPQSDSYSSKAWNWQRCSEVVMPRGYGDETMFEAAPYNENNFINMCKRRYGVGARPRWVTTYYGGHDIKLILKRFGSNIIFSNGLKDPFSAGGVLKDISDTIRVVKADYGTHCQDLLPIKDTDPDWLVAMRKEEFQIIKQWIDQYYEDLKSYNQVVTKKEKNI
ncbi:lysosomal Pro-X carboxypeptidase-like [Tripterygium wilfordii]|uniref:lysosomal Pro-X carboxypeptidase-like n=1 Tax=Tripterygium wilfordii TaxID=458696 RepID=UPI0018F8571A|nr:lysosomal Pro-X carboxypeptidase-like [Tripterygium wilfordii]